MINNKINYFRTIDKAAGNLICKGLSIDKFLNEVKKEGKEIKKIKNILIIKLWGLGSILLLTPCIRALKNKYPKAKITILTLEQNRAMCERIKGIDRIITIRLDGTATTARRILRIISLVKKEVFDVVLDFEFLVSISAIITYLSNAGMKIGFKSLRVPARNKLYDKTGLFNKKQHVTSNFARLLKPLGINKIDISVEKPKVTIEEKRKVLRIIKRAGINKEDKIVCININAGRLAFERRWPKEYFIELTKRIIRKYTDAKILFIGSKEEESYVKSALTQLNHKSVINLAGKLSIPELQALFEKTSLFITNDSGPMHLAAVVGTKSICLFGPESPVLYAPLNKNSITIYKNLKCSPCMDIYNRKIIKCHSDAECMKKITINEVFRKVKQIMDKS